MLALTARPLYTDKMLAQDPAETTARGSSSDPAPTAPAGRARSTASRSRTRVDAYRRLLEDVSELAAVSRRVTEPEAAQAGITGAQWNALSALVDGPATVPMIAERLGVTRQAIQRIADELVVAHLVERRPNPRHARSPLHLITPEGQRRLDRLTVSALGPRARAVAEVTTEQLVSARETLRAVIDGMLRPGPD